MCVLTWLDWFGTLSLIPLSHGCAAGLAPQLSRQDLQEAIHCIAGDGRIQCGARCIRFVGMRLPLLVPVALFLRIPGIIQIAEILYQMDQPQPPRYEPSLRLQGSPCAILPARPRAQDELRS